MPFASLLKSVRDATRSWCDFSTKQRSLDQAAAESAALAESERRERVVAGLARQYVDVQCMRGVAAENFGPAPTDWLNHRLKQRGERWQLPE